MIGDRRGGKHKAPVFVAYLACVCCGHWWPLVREHIRELIDPSWFICPYCSQGRKKACDAWDGETRTPPVPPRLDVRLPKDDPA